jgi:F420-0:gamma-glutamyl ligase
MNVQPIKTRRLTAGAIGVAELLDTYINELADASVVAITSKAVSLCEGNVVPLGQATKAALVEAQSDRYLATLNQYGFQFTITKNTLIPSAGIDESNGGGDYVLWPKDAQMSANLAREHLCERFSLRHVGIIITDSTCTPLRRGTSGICLAHSGFEAAKDYVGKPDLFGRPFRVSQANIAGGLAAAAVLTMGEGTERTPLCLITDVTFLRFQARNPTRVELEEAYISPTDDLFTPMLDSLVWKDGGKGAGLAGS